MSLIVVPDRNSAPPVETWTIPSLSASANPRSAALSVCEELTLIAGYANRSSLARSSIAAYDSGVAIGMSTLLRLSHWERDAATNGLTSAHRRPRCAPVLRALV